MTESGGCGPSVGGELAVLQVTITRPKIMGHTLPESESRNGDSRSSTKRSDCNLGEVVAYSLQVLLTSICTSKVKVCGRGEQVGLFPSKPSSAARLK